ncbi:phosphoribosylanthranilate isomerase [Persicobacter psychrovividus]|uniref:N-(5'-phosphoribosyl)anthranilate isomerase n=1 Tax=Persicobacter psychrovividus TaxID=387638 RepID=A0ABN6LBQ2_9BACT|nr:N-(5'-phosphoribosyl)anthranilate isomerase [Persicobacter psychrovividus]
MLWKVCGMRSDENIRQVAKLRPDFMGFIFYPKSPRHVEDLDQLVESFRHLNEETFTVAVMVNPTIAEAERIIKTRSFDYLQLHGKETPEFCASIKAKGVKVIKNFAMDENFDVTQLDRYRKCVDLFLFDTKTKQHGGSGETFDWKLLEQLPEDLPYLLSGGLSLKNIKRAKRLHAPAPQGIDVNSRFEIEPALKDVEKLKELKRILKEK